jgi:hypothetical protein
MTLKVSETFFCPKNSHRQTKGFIAILSEFWTSDIKNFANPLLEEKKMFE